MLLDANLLLYAVDSESRHHARAVRWLEEVLNGTTRVGIPWASITAFLRIVTHPRALERPLPPGAAWEYVEDWLSCRSAWVPLPTDRHRATLSSLLSRYDIRGNLVPDAHLAALAIEHGLELCSADTDFARFPEVRWTNPVA